MIIQDGGLLAYESYVENTLKYQLNNRIMPMLWVMSLLKVYNEGYVH